MSYSYVFDSFLPYLESIQLSRGISGLLRLRAAVESGSAKNISQQLYMRTYFNLAALFPQLNDPSENTQRLRLKLESELLHQAPSDQGAKFNAIDRREVRQLLDSLSPAEWQELNMTQQISRTGVEEFILQGMLLLQKLTAPLPPRVSLLEDMTQEVVKGGQNDKGLARLIEVWEQAKMIHEGYPPYFSKLTDRVLQVIRSLDSKFKSPISNPTGCHISPRRARFARQVLLNGQESLPHLVTPSVCQSLLGTLEKAVKQ